MKTITYSEIIDFFIDKGYTRSYANSLADLLYPVLSTISDKNIKADIAELLNKWVLK